MTRNVPIGGKRSSRRRAAVAAAGLAGAAVLTGALTQPVAHASGGPVGLAVKQTDSRGSTLTELRSPPKPPTDKPGEPSGYQPPTGLLPQPQGRTLSQPQVKTAVAATPAQAKTWGATGSATTLVLYDSTNTFGWLGELYAIGAGNLATHFGTVTAEPVVDYQSGQVNDYTATIYLGSTYNEPIPTTFLNDALTTTKPVIWVGDNIWQLSGQDGTTANTAFQAAYGWDPGSSYFDTTDTVSSVGYKGQSFTRSLNNAAGIIAPNITTPAAVTTLAAANCTDATGSATNCAAYSYLSGTSFPWAVKSGNLTYVGEIPFSYMSPTDRYLAFADMLFGALAPTAAPSHLAMVRLEDVSPESSAANLDEFAAYLKSAGVPFSMAVIPQYLDPNGTYNNGVADSESLVQEPTMVSALKTAVADGGTIVEHGYTHQYSNVDNPYDGATADDFEFYRAQCATTQSAPYTFDTPCLNTDYVIEEGPVPGDSQAWALGRVETGRAMFTLAGLPQPTIWETPHYAASAADYAAIKQVYQVKYEQELFFGGELTGAAINYSHVFGQFFPYEVHDVYGDTVIPENLGDYEPTELNNNPPRTAQGIINEAEQNTAVTQGVASFFIHPDYDPLSVLQQIVEGIKAEGYTFVSPQTLMADNG